MDVRYMLATPLSGRFPIAQDSEFGADVSNVRLV